MEDMSTTKRYEYVDKDDHRFDNHYDNNCDNDYVDDFYDG